MFYIKNLMILKIIIDVKDAYIKNINDNLHGLNAVMIEKINVSDFMKTVLKMTL